MPILLLLCLLRKRTHTKFIESFCLHLREFILELLDILLQLVELMPHRVILLFGYFTYLWGLWSTGGIPIVIHISGLLFGGDDVGGVGGEVLL